MDYADETDFDRSAKNAKRRELQFLALEPARYFGVVLRVWRIYEERNFCHDSGSPAVSISLAMRPSNSG